MTRFGPLRQVIRMTLGELGNCDSWDPAVEPVPVRLLNRVAHLLQQPFQ